MDSLSPAQTMALSNDQLHALTAAQVAAMDANQLAALSDAQVALLDLSLINSAQAAAMATAGNLDNLSAAQVASLLPEAIDSVPAPVLDNLTATEMNVLTNGQLSALTNTQVAAGFAVHAFDNLTPERLLLVDRVPPEAPTYLLSTGSNIGAQSVITGSAEPNGTVVLTLDPDNNPSTANNIVYTVQANQQGTWSVDLANAVTTSGVVNFSNGATVGVSVVAKDAAGNTSVPAAGTHNVATQTLYSIQMVGANDLPIDASNQPITSANEGAVARFMVTRTGDLSTPGTVTYATENGTASATSNDYTAASGTLNFAVGVAKQFITVNTLTDAVIEPNENFTVRLSAATGGTLSNSSVQAVVNDMQQSNWSVTPVTTDVSEQAGKAVFTVTRTGDSAAAGIDIFTSGGSALAGSDYTKVDVTRLSFAAGQMSQTFEVLINNDTELEAVETLQVAINNPSAGNMVQSTATVNIIDNDQSIWSIASNGDVSEAAGKAYFTVSRVGSTSSAASVTFNTSGGTATGAALAGAGGDYLSKTETISFAAGEISKVVEVIIEQDTIQETNETISAAIALPSGGGTLAVASATLSILDDDQSVWSIAADQKNVVESATSISYTITRTGATGAANILFSADAGTATAGSDYTAITNQTVSFAAGQMSKTVVVTLIDDVLKELNETVVASISAVPASGGTVNANAASATVTLLEDDQSIFSMSAAAEVSETAGYIIYNVSRTGSSQATTVGFMTAGGSAIAGSVLVDGVDYKTTQLIDGNALVFATGEMEKTVKVQIQNDLIPQGTRTVSAMLTQAGTGSALSADTAVTTSIIDDDTTVWAIGTATSSVDEGAGSMTFTITRQGKSDAQSITFATVGGTATANSDYVLAAPQVISFGAGEMSKTVSVALIDDTLLEPVKSLAAVISSPTDGLITQSSVTVNITDNDQSIWNVTKVADAQEGQPLMVRVWRTGLLNASSINLITSSAQAEAGVDYTDATQVLSFAQGEESKTISIASLVDGLPEPTEYISARIASPTQGSVGTSEATLALFDTSLSTWSVSSSGTGTTTEGGALAFTVSRTGDISQAATITVGISADGTAVAGTDYIAKAPAAMSFAAGESSKTYYIETLPNTNVDSARTVGVTITAASAGTLEKTTAIASILDDEAPAWTISALNDADEGTRMGFVVSRTGGRQAATIKVASVGGTAIGGAAEGGVVDYQRMNETLSFADGEMEKIIWVNTYNDTIKENNKTVVLAISEPSVGVFSQDRAVGTLLDNDSMIWAIRSVSGGVEGSPLVYEVYRTGGDLSAATITVGTNGFSAIAGMDHVPLWQVLSFGEGQKSQLVTVQTINDTLPEGTETVSLVIGNNSKGFISGQAKNYQYMTYSAIVDNDAITPVFNISSSSSVNEGSGYVTVTVTRTGAINNAVSVDYKTIDGTVTSANNISPSSGVATAYAGVNYGYTAGTLSFAAGETTKAFNVSLIDNTVQDGSKAFSVALLNPSNGVIQSTGNTVGVANIVITDNEKGATAAAATTYSFVADDLNVTQSTQVYESSGTGVFTLVRSGDLSATTTYFRTGTAGTAVAGIDYTAVGQGTPKAINWLEGQSRQTVLISLTDDALRNGTRTVVGQHSTNGTDWATAGIATSSTLSILDDEATYSGGAVTYAASSAYYLSAEGGGAFFVVDRNGDLSQTTISYVALKATEGTLVRNVQYTWDATTQFDAASGKDYATLTWAPGETSKVIAARFIDDGVASPRQTLEARFVTSLSDLSAGGVAATVIKGFDSQAVTLSDAAQEENSSSKRNLDMAGGNDIYTYTWTEASASDQVKLGAGNDMLASAISPTFMRTTGFVIDGGAGLDVIDLQTTSGYNASSVASYHWDFSNHYNSFYGFEMLRMSSRSGGTASVGKDMVSFNLATLVEMTKNNLNPYVFKVVSADTTTGMNDTFRISDAQGKTLYTPAVGTTFTGVNGESGTVVADTDGDGANEVVLVKDQSFGQYYGFSGAETQTAFDIFQYDHNGQRMSVLVQKDIQFIGSQPKATLTSGTAQSTGTATVSSSVQGVAYLVKDSVTVTDLASITSAADNTWNSVAITGTSINTAMSLTGLVDGNYKLYATDIDGTLSKAAMVNGVVTTFTVDNNPPAALTLTMPTYTNPGAAAYAYVSGMETAVGTTWEYKVGIGAWTRGAGDSFALPTGFQASPQEVQVRQTDVAGNVGLVRSSNDATGVVTAQAAQELRAWLLAADALASGGKESYVMVGGQLERVHTFNTVNANTTLSSSFVNASGGQLALDYTLVGGGGAGGSGNWNAGGGGGGGMVVNNTVTVDAGSTAITVGAGGLWSTSTSTAANNGGSTIAAFAAGTVTAFGGTGGTGSNNPANNYSGTNTTGGTGGGAGFGTGTTGGVGQNGAGSGAASTTTTAGGGGGAGGNASTTTGGAGALSTVTGLTYGGGGGGGTNSSASTTVGGTGGGGSGMGTYFARVENPSFSAGSIDGLLPTFSNARISATNSSQVNLFYNEQLDPYNIPSAQSYTVTVAGATRAVTSTEVVGNVVTLNLASAVTAGQVVTLAYTDATDLSYAQVRDLSGFNAASLSAGTTVTNSFGAAADTTAPTRIGANMRFGSNKLTLEYNELLDTDPTHLPAAGNFTVVDALNSTTIAVTGVEVKGASVILTLATSVAQGTAIGVRYTDPTTGNDVNAIQDLAGNDAATINSGAITSSYVNVLAASGVNGLGGGGGGAGGGAGSNLGGQGGGGAAILAYKSNFDEAALLTFLQNIETTTDGGAAHTLVQSSLHTYLNVIETASLTDPTWAWTNAKIAAVL